MINSERASAYTIKKCGGSLMDFVIRFLILTVITFTVLSVATEKWAKHYVWLIIGFMILAGFVFIV